MQTPRIYVDTTIFSAYHHSRSHPDMLVQRERTRRWWQAATESCQLVTSLAVLRELAKGKSPHVRDRLALASTIDLVDLKMIAFRIADVYIYYRIMPADPRGDALHLAVASYHRCDYLVTWNYKHLANPNKFASIRRINGQLGLFTPVLATPQQLMGGPNEEDAGE